MASFDTNLQMWRANNGTYWPDKASAESADAAPNDSGANSGPSFDTSAPVTGLNSNIQAPHDPNDDPNPANPGGISNNLLQQRQFANNPFNGPQALQQLQNQTTASGNNVDQYGNPYSTLAPGTPTGQTIRDSNGNPVQVVADSSTQRNTYNNQLGTVNPDGSIGGVQQLSFTPNANANPAAGSQVPAQTQGAIDQAHTNVTSAQDAYNTEAAQNATNDPILAQRAADAAANVQGPDNTQSDQSRKLQQESAQQQRDLLARLQAFDPKQYATQFADSTLARNVALARGSSSSPAAQQAATMAALDKSPEAYAQGQQQADQLENQRLSQAEQAATAFGNLATGTRGQDLNQSQFSAQFGLNAAQNIEQVSQGQIKLDQTQQQALGDLYVNWGRIASVYDSWPVDMQRAWLENQTRLALGDQQLKGIEDQIKAKGAITDKDWLTVFTGFFGDATKAAGAAALV